MPSRLFGNNSSYPCFSQTVLMATACFLGPLVTTDGRTEFSSGALPCLKDESKAEVALN